MGGAIALRCEAEDKRDQDEADGLFLFRSKDEDFAADRRWIVPVGFHSISALPLVIVLVLVLVIVLQGEKIRSKIRSKIRIRSRRNRCNGGRSL
jgi:hypothetical protein